VPLLFHPVMHQGRALLDGGILDRPGLAGVSQGARVFHHHLSSRSPWRSARAMLPPSRPNLVSLVAKGLPRSSPFRLDAGLRAFDAAALATRTALNQRVSASGLVEVACVPRP
jgi:NTE family protein